MRPRDGCSVPDARWPMQAGFLLRWPRLPAALARCLLPLLTIAATPCVAQTAPPAARAAAIIVLDGSNSMNARLPGDKTSKLISVREALRASLPKTSRTELGLVAFGGRRNGDCNDVEMLASPNKDTGPVMAGLESFQPRGFSPVALSLREAAKALPSSGKADIVLVLDDLASCRAEDPCAVATSLKRENPALSIHVVVLGPRPSDLPVLACVVRQTGGQLFQVTDAAGLSPAVQEVLVVAGIDSEAKPQPPTLVAPPQAASPQRPAAKAAATTTKPASDFDPAQPGVHLSTRLSESAPALLLPTSWRVWRIEERTTDTGETTQSRGPAPIIETTSATLSRRLANGRYEVEAKTGLVSARRNFEVTSEAAMPVPVDLNAALLTIAAPQAKGAPAAPETRLEVQSLGANPAPVWVATTGAHDLVVPPGSYRVTATAGLAIAERVLTVGPGVSGHAEMPLEAGRLVIEGTPPPGAAAGSQVILEADDPNAPDGRRELYRAASGRLELMVPASSYLVTVRSGGAELRDRVQIRAGETVRRAGAVSAARVRLTSRIGQALPPGMPVTYRIERIDIPSRPTLRWSEGEAPLALSPGRYRIEARVGSQNAAATREIDVKPGPAEQRIELDTGAGSVALRLAGADPGLGLGEVYWQVFADSGAAVWRTGEAEPVLALMPGRYRIRADTRDRMLENMIEVRPGDNRTVEIGG